MVYSKSINEILKLYTRSFLLQFLYSTETQSPTDHTPVRNDTKGNTDRQVKLMESLYIQSEKCDQIYIVCIARFTQYV